MTFLLWCGKQDVDAPDVAGVKAATGVT